MGPAWREVPTNFALDNSPGPGSYDLQALLRAPSAGVSPATRQGLSVVPTPLLLGRRLASRVPRPADAATDGPTGDRRRARGDLGAQG